MNINLDDYGAGGYFVTRYADGKSWRSADLIPEKVLSIDTDIMPLAPLEAALKPLPEIYESYGISTERISSIEEWYQEHSDDIGWPQMFYTLAPAQGFAASFVTRKEGVVILSVAVHRKYIPRFEIDVEGLVCPVEENFRKGRTLAADGELLGFDVLSYKYCQFASWLRYSFPELIYSQIGIRPNEHGYLGSQKEADLCDQYMDKDEDMRSHGWWLPWLIAKYPLE